MPGDQIRPEDPRRWLLVKREMPVPDPSSGENRWSIDHFFVDQSGIPTFVECKRFLDTRSRREVVGQMLDYAANGHFYWDKSLIRDYAERRAKERGIELSDAIAALEPETDSIDEFFEILENNLREGQVRLIFFMEEAPQELKSVVDFLNKQMERSEVLIVEAKQFEKEGIRVVSPALFGYTEESRRVKRTVKVTSTGTRNKWDEKSFFEKVRNDQPEHVVEACREMLAFGNKESTDVRWGTGKVDGSFSFAGIDSFKKVLLSVYSSGWLAIPFGSMVGGQSIETFRDELFTVLNEEMQFQFPENARERYPNIRAEEWVPKVDKLIVVLSKLLKKYAL
jgi:hypothetical protein